MSEISNNTPTTLEPVSESISPNEAQNSDKKHDAEITPNDEPSLKRVKLESEIVSEQFTNSPSPAPHALTSNSRSEIREQIDQLTKTGNPISSISSLSPSPAPLSSIVTENTSIKAEESINIEVIPQLQNNETIIKKSDSKQESPTAVSPPSKTELIAQSNRKVEDIIDGSDLRKFLHKSLTEYLVKGLDEIVAAWELGEFEISENDNDEILRKSVVLKFADILKNLAEK
jgi:hypothetical protein